MNHDDLRHWSKRAADWAHAYHATLRDRPVRAQTTPGATASRLPAAPPEDPEPIETIVADFEAVVPDAMTHWQHPRFFAYFPANAAPASMLAEQLANAIAAQAMLWQTSPAATEIEQVMVSWLRDALGLSPRFTGTIHDSATTATLAAILTMRERATDWEGNASGLASQPTLRLYASTETHSSIDKGARIAGIGQANLVKVPTDESLALDPGALDAAVRADLAAGYRPAGVVLCAGGTSVGAFDRMRESIAVAKEHGLYTHVDAAWAGSAMICPEFRGLWDGVDDADSIVVNPHKWLGAQFDCSLQFLADPTPQVRTLGLRPEYLETLGHHGEAGVITNFNEWTVPLGRRFRALKLWFTLRAYGLSGLRRRIRDHVAWSRELVAALGSLPGVEIATPPALSLFTFALEAGDAATEALLTRINDDGRVYLTQTRHRGRFVIRVQVGQFDCTRDDVMTVLEVVRELS
jgi:aromatic-L-amino-acid/L-tryptophan decarboxylase